MNDQPVDSCDELGLPNCNPGDNNIGDIVEIFFLVIGFLATLYLIIAGIQYATSAGDPQRAAQAKNSIIYALVGVALSFSVYAIMNYLFSSGGALQT